MPIHPISVIFILHDSFYDYIQPNQFKTRERKKTFQKEQFFFDALLFYFGVSVSSLLNKESMVLALFYSSNLAYYFDFNFLILCVLSFKQFNLWK